MRGGRERQERSGYYSNMDDGDYPEYNDSEMWRVREVGLKRKVVLMNREKG